jgi:formylglycine-generating enzyme required for sulfatase activity
MRIPFVASAVVGGLLGLGLIAAWGWQRANIGTDGMAATTALACSSETMPTAHPGMVWVSGGRFTMGAEYSYVEEGGAHDEEVAGFWMSRTEVTNAEFAAFVQDTGYVTLAERGIGNPLDPTATPIPGSAVFKPIIDVNGFNPMNSWWQFVPGAHWREPQGPGSSIEGLQQHPVVHIAFEDAEAYARWKGQRLPSEAEFEYAAQGEGPQDAAGHYTANTWQGFFPFENDASDGHLNSSPVGCFTANRFGLHDLIGNVWEWTASPFYPGHNFADKAARPEGYDPLQPEEPAVAVIKGGSFLCAANYCMRYRPEARQGQSKGLGTSHIGFRTVLDAAPPSQ